MRQITIGGERLGSGKKMKAEIHGFGRSTHNLSYIFRTTMSPGTLVPFICEVGLPADTFDIDLDSIVKTLPTVGPLFGSYKAQFDIHMCPIRLYNGLMHNNTLNAGRNVSQIKLPVIRFTATQNNDGTDITVDNINTAQVNPSSLPAYLGIRGIGSWDGVGDAPTRDFNATAIIAYWDCVKNYYSNKQEGIAAVIHTPAVALITTVDEINIGTAGTSGPLPGPGGGSDYLYMIEGSTVTILFTGAQPLPSQILIETTENGTKTLEELCGGFNLISGSLIATYNFNKWGTDGWINWRYTDATDINTGQPAVYTFPLTELDRMRGSILQNLSTNPFIINTMNNFEPYKFLYEQPNGVPNILSNQEGLALKCYQSDIFNNWLNSEWIDGTNGVTEVTSIDTSTGSFTIDALIIGRKVYNMLNKIVMSDGTLDSWQEVVYDHRPFSKAETPMYQGGLIKEVIFQEVVSNSMSNDQPLGTLAGRGNYAGKHKGGKIIIKVDEPCYILGIVSLTPRLDYSQGNRWDVHLKSLDDLHKPDLDQIGFQESIVEERAYWDTNWNGTQWVQNSAGKLPAWENYMTNHNRTFGDFAIEENSMFMTLNRRYEAMMDAGNVKVKDLTTYIDPVKYNYIFAQTNLSAMNFWMQISVDMIVRRKMSAKIMPNL